VQAETVERNSSGNGYVIDTSPGRFEAKNVVIATGLYQQPKIPTFSGDFPADVMQLHSDQ
jgi:putative flavoprotein involved in K+ transport